MSKIKPYNNIVTAMLVNEEKKSGSIFVGDNGAKRFVDLEIIDVGEGVDFKPPLKKGDRVIANALFEIVDPVTKIGFINSKDILAKYE